MKKNVKNVMIMMLTMYVGLFFSGCLNLEKMSIRYDIDKDLAGQMVLKFIGINSDEETEAEKKKEMSDFYDKYIKDGKEQAEIWCLKNGKTELTDKTDLKCNATVTGEIWNIMGSLYPITEKSDFEIKKNSKTFSVEIASCKISEEDLPVEVSIKYAGKILSHNANEFDKKNNLMTWSGKKMEQTGIRFVLEVNE